MFCNKCGTEVQDGQGFCPKCGTAVGNAQPMNNNVTINPPPMNHMSGSGGGIVCPRCGSTNCTVQLVEKKQKHGIVWWICIGWWLFLIMGIFILLFKKKPKTVTYALCQSCGNNWEIKSGTPIDWNQKMNDLKPKVAELKTKIEPKIEEIKSKIDDSTKK